jgi:hypothetical protein
MFDAGTKHTSTYTEWVSVHRDYEFTRLYIQETLILNMKLCRFKKTNNNSWDLYYLVPLLAGKAFGPMGIEIKFSNIF